MKKCTKIIFSILLTISLILVTMSFIGENIVVKTFSQEILSKKISGRRISVLTDCHGNEMIKRMAHSHCVVIPLKDIYVSSGQLVILQSMALGKPVICTDADGIRDYTSTDTTIMIPNDVDKWKKALNLLYNDEQLYNKLSDSSYDFYEKNFTDIVMYRNIANIINTDKYENIFVGS